MISIRRMSLGSGYRYLMESVAVGDGGLRTSSLVDYYAESGTPRGRFLGAGLVGLDDGKGIRPGTLVSAEHLFQMLGMCADPVTGKALGRTPNRAVQSMARRIAERIGEIPATVTGVERVQLIARIEAEEQSRSGRLRPPVAGFDLTFSPSKSISAAWALADEETKAVIYDCHRRAIDIVLAYAEREVFHSRSGTDGVVQEDIVGVVAAAFTHWDSRSGDPQLHDHVVVLNRAQSISDGKWRTLDSRGLFKAVVMLSEMHQGVVSDLLTEKLDWGWDGRTHRHSDRLAWEVAGLPEALMAEFSQRSAAIKARKNLLVGEFVNARGRQPTAAEVIRLRQQATLETRPEKAHRSLAEMTAEWRQRATSYVGEDSESWVASLADGNDLPLLRAEDLGDEILADVARVALERVGGNRATFSRFNIAAEVHRQLQGVRFATPADRIKVAELTTDLALGEALLINPPLLHHTPEPFLRPNGTSRFRAKGHENYTTGAVLDAEARLLDAGRRLDGPSASRAGAAHAEQPVSRSRAALSIDQAVAVDEIATSGRFLDVLVGPAGTGKSATMAALRVVWEAEHGPGSVIGLAPSAAAAEVLAEELGIDTENTAKWLFEHRRQPSRQAKLDELRQLLAADTFTPAGQETIRRHIDKVQADLFRWRLAHGQLVIIDEASLAGTFALDELVTAASDAGAKVLLVGDPAQLSAVEAGGMFATLVADRDGYAPELTAVHRFAADWERAASVALRNGDLGGIDAYESHERVIAGGREELLDALYTAWRADTEAGRSSLMIAPDKGTVAELNRRARADRVAAGQVADTGLGLGGGEIIGVGDLVVTRQNDRTLMGGGRWVRNGDRWIVTALLGDGSLRVSAVKGQASVVLPAEYAVDNVELGYAATAYRSQGRTLDTAHAFVSPATTPEVLYVSATRGRTGNHLYVDTGYDPDPDTGHDETTHRHSARDVLAGVLHNEGADVSAHEAIRRAHEYGESIANLAAEYQTIVAFTEHDRWEALMTRSGLTPIQVEAVRASQSYGPLRATLGDAENRGLDVDRAFPALVRGRMLVNADDVAAVLHHRVTRWLDAHEQLTAAPPELVAGLLERAVSVRDPDASRALTERDTAIRQRADTLAESAAAAGLDWVQRFGRSPVEPAARREWMRCVAVVAAYRERWGIEADPRPLGAPDGASTTEQQRQRARARVAGQRAFAVSRWSHLNQLFASSTPSTDVQHDIGPSL
jgi:conjugative relaxase-like TrwC/TraI family protein